MSGGQRHLVPRHRPLLLGNRYKTSCPNRRRLTLHLQENFTTGNQRQGDVLVLRVTTSHAGARDQNIPDEPNTAYRRIAQ